MTLLGNPCSGAVPRGRRQGKEGGARWKQEEKPGTCPCWTTALQCSLCMNIPALPDTQQLLHQPQLCNGLALPQHPTGVPTGVPVGSRAQLSGCGAGNAVCAHNLPCSLGCCTPHIAERVSDRKCTFLQSRYSLRSRVLLLLVPRCSRRRGKLPKPRDPARGQRQRQLLPSERSGRGRGSAPELRSASEMWVTSSPRS